MEVQQTETDSGPAPSTGAATLDVVKPAPGAVILVESSQTQNVAFKFPFASAKLAILDVDLVVIFDDGGKVILPGLAVRMLGGDAPKLRFQDQDVDPSSVIARVGDVQLADQLPLLAVSASLKVDKQEPVAPSNGIPVVQMPSLPPASLTPSPARRGTLDTEIETGSISASSGRFAKRTNAIEEVASARSGGQTESNDPAEAPKVEAKNLDPTVTSNGGGAQASLTMAENSRAATRVAGTDPEKNKLHYAIASGADADKFAINSETGELYLVQSADFELPGSSTGSNVYSVTIAVLDEFGGSDEQGISVTITNVNEAPTNAFFSSSVLTESAGAGAVVGTVTAVDPDAAAVLTFSFAPQGNAGGRFLIDSLSGVVTVASGTVFDASTNPQETIIVRVTDQDGLSFDKTFVLDIIDTNRAPVILSDGGGSVAQVVLSENTASVSTVYARDPDGQTVTYSLAGGADAALFSIDATTGALRFLAPPNFEFPGDANGDGRYEVIVQASDGTLIDLQTFLIDVVNVNEAPTSALLSANTIAENAAAGTVVGVVTGIDPDAGDVLTFGFVAGGDAGGRFQINAVTGVISLATGALLDFGTDPFHVVTVRVTDAGGLSYDQLFVIELINSNNAPVIVSDGGGPTAIVNIDENDAVATVVAASDTDPGALVIYSIIGGADQARFTINPNTGVLRFLSAPDFEFPGDANGDNNYEVIVLVSDGSLTDQQVLTISVHNANEPPTITSDGGGASTSLFIVENGTSVTTVTATDQDAGSSIVYFISGGADETLFEIDSVTGVLRFRNAPNYEAPADADGDNIYEVIVLASDGGLFDSQLVRVTVTNQNEIPRITSDGGGLFGAISLAENTSLATTVTAVDPDIAAMLTYVIIGGADQARFTINATTGVLTFVSPPDFENPVDVGGDNIYDVIVQVSDGLGGVDTQTLAITVTNTNDAPVITSDGGLVTA
ncbi:MAG: cadherin domain-containing protein, partial [Beijerinckiaceae bacterium]